MSRDVTSLQPAIHAILTRPGVDLSTISAKRVRKQLLAEDPSLTEEWVRENKKVLDSIIASVFTQVSPPSMDTDSNSNENGQLNGDGGESEAGPSETGYKPEEWSRNGGGVVVEEDMVDEGNETEKKPAKKAKKPKKQAAMTDEEYAQQLSDQLNSRTRSFRSGVTKGTGSKRGRGGKGKNGRRGPISAATVDSEGDGDESDPTNKKRRKRSGGGGGAKGGFSKEYALSEPLATLMQAEKLSRPQVVKKLWEHIKGNNLQNPSNKKEILCDDSLRAIFAQDKIDMFRMNKVLGHHLMEASET